MRKLLLNKVKTATKNWGAPRVDMRCAYAPDVRLSVWISRAGLQRALHSRFIVLDLGCSLPAAARGITAAESECSSRACPALAALALDLESLGFGAAQQWPNQRSRCSFLWAACAKPVLALGTIYRAASALPGSRTLVKNIVKVTAIISVSL
jgi:hypothetical protein